MRLDPQTWAKLGGLVGGALWGAFWVPVRMLEDAGFQGFWAVAGLYAVAAVVLFPYAAFRWRRVLAGGLRLHATCIVIGWAMAAYAGAFLYTEVIPAVLLYYLSPVWGFLLARIFFNDKITPARWVAMVLALLGAAMIFGVDTWPPMPRNQGDWMALGSGLAFVIGSMMMLSRPEVSSLEYSTGFLIWGAVGLVALSLIQPVSPPSAGEILQVLPWLGPIALLVLIPGCFAAIHAASVLNPGIVGILFMAEIGVSVILAALLTDEPIGPNQIGGVVLIAMAGALEGIVAIVRRRRARGEIMNKYKKIH